MTAIQDILDALREVPGIKGAALVTPDGIVIGSSLSATLNTDVVAGLASFLITTTRRSLREGGLGKFTRFVLQATNGKVMLIDLGDSFLVVHTDQFARLESSRVEVEEAAREIQRASRVNVS
ncbi:MAG TPA: roadblock/LC7 domain-containing protein [Planctomycetota bacterium]|nr:roadblock/LC7 domain-containing protein [Planctomycetota bacterium]